MGHYATLGVAENASQVDIKKAYRTLSKKFHPDKNPNGAEQFINISEAYDTLKDPKKREQYDARSNTSGFFDQFNSGGGFNRGNMSDMFDQVFSNAYGSQPRQKGQDYRIDMHISFGEAYTGTSKTFDLNGGRVAVDFKAGLLNGQQFRLAGKGAPHPINTTLPNGDLLVTIHVIPQAEFILEGTNIWIERQLPWWDIMLGCDLTVLTPEGHVTIKIPKGSYPGKTLRIKGKGFPIYGSDQKGALLCRINSNYPELNEEQFEYIEKIKTSEYEPK